MSAIYSRVSTKTDLAFGYEFHTRKTLTFWGAKNALFGHLHVQVFGTFLGTYLEKCLESCLNLFVNLFLFFFLLEKNVQLLNS